MPEIDLNGQRATNLFDLKGVVAVVTGGGSVSQLCSLTWKTTELDGSFQGIGLMISSTLLANGATVYIIGPKQADLDRYKIHPKNLCWQCWPAYDRICGIYNNANAKLQLESGGKMYGLEGDISLKVCSTFNRLGYDWNLAGQHSLKQKDLPKKWPNMRPMSRFFSIMQAFKEANSNYLPKLPLPPTSRPSLTTSSLTTLTMFSIPMRSVLTGWRLLFCLCWKSGRTLRKNWRRNLYLKWSWRAVWTAGLK